MENPYIAKGIEEPKKIDCSEVNRLFESFPEQHLEIKNRMIKNWFNTLLQKQGIEPFLSDEDLNYKSLRLLYSLNSCNED